MSTLAPDGLFEAFYQSPVQHPFLLWASNLAGTVLALLALRSRPAADAAPLGKFILFWALISMLDAWASANHVFGVGALQAPWSSLVPFVFVWLGDFRIFLAMEIFGKQGALGDHGLFRFPPRAAAACFVVPVIAGILTRGQNARMLFLVYEFLFLIWITLYGRITGLVQSPDARRIRNLALLFYSLWVISDALILTLPAPARDLGFGFRVLPNFIYYGWFGWACAIRTAQCPSGASGR
jgi:hypothetical protein